jgi:hypothetical protein
MDDQQTPQITINDLAVVKNLISVACERGAFRANEMTTVGEIYDKLTGFLEHIVAAAESAQQGETK